MDREAEFRRLFSEHHRDVLAYALRRCEQRADAEDVVTGTFAVAWRRFADAPAEELRLAWLYAIAARLLRSKLRAQPPTEAPERVDLGGVVAALRELQPEEQEILGLAAWEGLSNVELSVTLGCAENAAAIRLHRARKRLLAEANPVRVGDVPELGISASVFAHRRRPHRIAFAAAIAVAALAAFLIAAFTTRGRHSSPPMGSIADSTFAQTLAHPLAPPSKEVTLADATAAIGRPVVLPDTSLVSPSDAGPVWLDGELPTVTAAVTFPSQGIFIDYIVSAPSRDPSATYQAIAGEDPRSFETIDLDGRTALAVKQNTDDTGHNFGGVIFVLNGFEIRVFGHYDEATLQSVAQSIVDRSNSQ